MVRPVLWRATESRFKIAIGLLNGPNNYGPRCRLADGSEELYCILGVWARGQTGQPAFGADVVETVVHEFCHSYANPLIDRHETELKPAGPRSVCTDCKCNAAAGLQAQWKTVLYESLVRACTLRYIRQYRAGVAESKAMEEARPIVPLGSRTVETSGLVRNRARKVPHARIIRSPIIAFFDDQAKRPVKRMTGSDAAPKVISITPKNGASDVDPALGEIKVVFDRPMRNSSWSMVGDPAEDPKTAGKPSYNAARTTWTVPIRLKPPRITGSSSIQSVLAAFQSERRSAA